MEGAYYSPKSNTLKVKPGPSVKQIQTQVRNSQNLPQFICFLSGWVVGASENIFQSLYFFTKTSVFQHWRLDFLSQSCPLNLEEAGSFLCIP